LLQCFSTWFFVFLWFFLKLSLSILFFNIELVNNYSYNMRGKHCSFPRKLLWIATVCFSTWFFYIFFSKIIFINFIFLILSWLKSTITSETKSCGENIVAFHTKHCGLLQFFLIWFFSSFFCGFFLIIFFKNFFVDFFLILS
jgi:hypothetical protein